MAVFKSGIPYAIDIKRLEERYPAMSLTEGMVIAHEDLEGLLDIKRGSQRYYGVINSWIKHQQNQNGVNMAWEHSIGIKVLNPAELMTFVRKNFDGGNRKVARAVRKHAFVDRKRLDEVGKARYDHEQKLYAKAADFLTGTRKELAIDLAPIKCLPKPKLIREAS